MNDPRFKPGRSLDDFFPSRMNTEAPGTVIGNPLSDHYRPHPEDQAVQNLASEAIRRIMIEEQVSFARAKELLSVRQPELLERALETYRNPRRMTVDEVRRRQNEKLVP